MTQQSYPFDTGTTSETQFSQLFKRLNTTGVSGSDLTTDLKVTGDSSGLQVKVAAGFALVRGHAYYSNAVETLAVAATTTLPRVDLVILKLDPVTANSIVLAVKQGTAAASPVAPSLTQDDTWTGGVWEFPIGRIDIPANTSTTITAGMVSDIRQYMGIPFGHWTTALRPTSPIQGTAGYNTTLGAPEYWDGSSWDAFTPTALNASVITTGQLVVARGGTGATDAATARTNLGAAAASHTHAIADVTNLQTTLDGKAASSHTHTAANITDQSNINAGKVNGIKIFVGATTPTGAVAGDLWFN